MKIWRIIATRRFIQVVLLMAWLYAVHWYWRGYVPLVPTEVLDSSDGHRFVAFSRKGHLMLAQHIGQGGLTGPIRYRDPIEHRIVREVLAREDTILNVAIVQRELAATERDTTISLIDLNDRRVLCTHPTGGLKWHVEISPDSSLVALCSGHRAVVREIDGGRIVWEREDEGHGLSIDFHSQDLMTLHTDLDPNSMHPSIKSESWNTQTWQLDGRFQGHTTWNESPDGRWTVVWINPSYPPLGPQHRVVGDLANGHHLWQLPDDVDSTDATFSSDSSELIYCTGTRRHINIARWRVDTGEVIEPIREPDRTGHAELSPDGRFVVFTPFEFPPPSASDWIVEAVNWLGVDWSGEIPQGERIDIVGDARTGSPLGVIYEHPGFEVDQISEHGLVLYGSMEDLDTPTRYYSLPPKRNWTWLLSWSILPPLTIASIRAYWRRRRMRRGSAGS